MNRPPAFRFYPDDFISGVSAMTQNEIGAYILLLAHSWNTGGLDPSDMERLKALAKGDISDYVLSKFKLKNGRLFNERLEMERRKQSEFREKQAINGAKGGRPKLKPKPNPSLSFGLSQTKPKKSLPFPVPVPVPSPNVQTHTHVPKGEEGGSKGETHAERIYQRTGDDGRTVSRVIDELRKRLCNEFRRPEGDFWTFEEERLLVEVAARPGASSEAQELFSYRLRNGCFFPRSVLGLLKGWTMTLDQSRNHQSKPTALDRSLVPPVL